MAFEGQLQADQPSWAPTGKIYEAKAQTTYQEAENTGQVTEAAKPITSALAINTIMAIQTLCISKPHLFDLATELCTSLQVQKFKTKIK